MVRRPGRRPGKQHTRETILAAARETFAECGYDGATIRQIATSAGVDPALVHHYFGTKEKLFLATIGPPANPAEIIGEVFTQLDGQFDQLGARLVDTFLSVWEHPVGGPAFKALVRGAVASQLSAKLLREAFASQIVRRGMRLLGTVVDPTEIPLRAGLVASQLYGLALTRYVVKLEPVASLPQAAVVAAIAPTTQRYLTGELPAAALAAVRADDVLP